ncbi:MAG: hypothetical protein J6B92_05840 [Paraprevotella sp.]|nr:hypothetical protein [Paraprevotella sp.]
MRRFLIRYGVFSILAVMVAGLALIAARYKVRVKEPVTFFATSEGGKVYTAYASAFSFEAGDTLTVCQTAYGDLRLVVDSILQEPAAFVFCVRPVNAEDFARRMAGNTYATGFLFTGKERMLDLMRKKVDF